MDSISGQPNKKEKELKEIISLIKSIIEELQNQQIFAAMHFVCFLLGLLLGEYIKIPNVLIFLFCILTLLYCIIKLNIKNIRLFLKNIIGDSCEKPIKYI